MKDKTEYIDFTPTWEAILPILLAVLTEGKTAKNRNEAAIELRRMAVLADKYVALRAMLDKENEEI